MAQHPARYSQEIVKVLREILLAKYPNFMGRPVVHDCYAGTGERLKEIVQDDFMCSGTELEASFIQTPWIIQGNATDPAGYPPARFPDESNTGGWVICTSVTYANGMADNYAGMGGTRRKTYRRAVAEIEGADRELHPENMGAMGYRASSRTGKSKNRTKYWDVANRSVENWASAHMLLVNVSDFMAKRKGVVEVEPHVQDWSDLLRKHGWDNQAHLPVGTRRMRDGANSDVRVDCEEIIIAMKTRNQQERRGHE